MCGLDKKLISFCYFNNPAFTLQSVLLVRVVRRSKFLRSCRLTRSLGIFRLKKISNYFSIKIFRQLSVKGQVKIDANTTGVLVSQ